MKQGDQLELFYSRGYAEARDRFRRAAELCGCRLLSYPLKAPGLKGDELSIDVAVTDESASERALVISSGMHGVEGPVGSAVQLALLRDFARRRIDVSMVRLVLIHALNPFGFAWRRRFNEDNVDLNRNLLLADQTFFGSPKLYQELDPHLNPNRPAQRWEPATLKILAAIARHGTPALRQAIAGGQYDYPAGLYYGGERPTESNAILTEQFDGWLGACRRVVHLDFHTGLGPWATCKLLLDYEPTDDQIGRLRRWFAPTPLEVMNPSGISFSVRGSFGQWSIARNRRLDYLYASAEFGTYRPTQILRGLRAENLAHHWGNPKELEQAKLRLAELFCPRSKRWRATVLQIGGRLIEQAIVGLNESRPDT